MISIFVKPTFGRFLVKKTTHQDVVGDLILFGNLWRIIIVLLMSAGPVSTNIHQIGNTLAWCVFFDVAVVTINLKYRKNSLLLHSLLGWGMLALTYIDILLLLIPNGFNVMPSQGNPVLLFIHGILGLCMMAFSMTQVIGGVLIRMQLDNKTPNLELLGRVKKGHKFFGVFLAIVYKINIIWSWIPTWAVMSLLVLWQIGFVSLLYNIKNKKHLLEAVVIDKQINPVTSTNIRTVSSNREILAITESFVLFQDYAYYAKDLAKMHPGGSKVIETVIGREVDRFLYGMYPSELLPEVGPHSHSQQSLRLVGLPFAKIVVPAPFDGFTEEVMKARISFVHKVSQQTQIYEFGLKFQSGQLYFKGYTTLQQLGQYYSLSINDHMTRLYTTVNFLTLGNIDLMLTLFPQLQLQNLYRNAAHPVTKYRETQLSLLKDMKKGDLAEPLLQRQDAKKKKDKHHVNTFLPIMMKIYSNGKFTSELKRGDFQNSNLKLSCPRGRGLELDNTPSGRIIVLAGGTGLFPFCDLIDLLYKVQLLREEHPEKTRILKQNPILESENFQRFTFLFLIAINEPEDLHPIINQQLVHLSDGNPRVKIVMRVSKNPERLIYKGNIEFTRDYFNKRVVSEATMQGLARVWICGPPKLTSDAATALLQAGLKRETILLI